MRRALPWLLALAPAMACDQAGDSLLPVPPQVGDGLPAGCSPLRMPGVCMMPWPNAIYLKKDPTTVTGYRVALDGSTLPAVSVKNTRFDPTRWNLSDGFSPAASMLTYFAERIDPASLVPEDDIGASLSPGAATVLVDMSTGLLVAHFSGVDENVLHPTDRQALVITPAQRLLPNRRYAVAITSAVRTVAGGAPTPPPLMQAMLHGVAPARRALAGAARADAGHRRVAEGGRRYPGQAGRRVGLRHGQRRRHHRQRALDARSGPHSGRPPGRRVHDHRG